MSEKCRKAMVVWTGSVGRTTHRDVVHTQGHADVVRSSGRTYWHELDTREGFTDAILTWPWPRSAARSRRGAGNTRRTWQLYRSLKGIVRLNGDLRRGLTSQPTSQPCWPCLHCTPPFHMATDTASVFSLSRTRTNVRVCRLPRA